MDRKASEKLNSERGRWPDVHSQYHSLRSRFDKEYDYAISDNSQKTFVGILS